MGKAIHLSVQQIKTRIEQLREQLNNEQTKTNKTKKKRVYHQIAQLKKALQCPQQRIVDPQQQQKAIQLEKEKRIQKKMQKKQQLVKEIKKEKKHAKRCLKCGSMDHLLQQCQLLQCKGGICYKCGSAEHSHKDCREVQYKLAECFHCGKQGHIARQCPTNEKGLYRKGGSCFGCGSVRHTLKDCPTRHKAAIYNNNKQQF